MDKKTNLEKDQLVLCTVTKIEGTTVFAKIDDYNLDGSITFMEIAPGRIRNIREYAFPGKKIVCKVLEIKPTHIELSFRRVKVNERNEFNEKYKREKSYSALLKTIMPEKFEETISRIKASEGSLFDFMEKAREDSKILEKYLSKEAAEKLGKVLSEKKSKETILSRKFSLSSKMPNGIALVKNLIKEASKEIPAENLVVSYMAAGKYFIKLKSKDPKAGDNQLNRMMQNLEALSKKSGCVFSEEKD